MSETPDTTATTPQAIADVRGLSHVRLTVTDIARSKQFYSRLFGAAPALDHSDEVDDPSVREDPQRFYGGCVYAIGDHLLGLRPVAEAGDRFDSTRVGLDHVSFQVGSVSDLENAVRRLEEAGIEHGEITTLEQQGIAFLSLQDPDDVNLELTAAL